MSKGGIPQAPAAAEPAMVEEEMMVLLGAFG
jgi:hypothetical protein